MGEAKLISAGRHRKDSAWHMDRHSHRCWEIVVVNSGAEEVSLQGGPRTLRQAGEAIVFQPFQSHEEWSLPDCGPLDSCFISCEHEGLASMPPSVKDSRGRLRLLSQWLHEEREASSSQAARRRELFFESFILELERAANQAPSGLVEESRARMKSGLNSAWSLESLSKAAGMSKFHFLRKYKALSGTTPMEDLRAIRSHAARDMILTSKLPLKEIAEACGLGGEVSLSRTFKKVFGVAPGSLRRQLRGS